MSVHRTWKESCMNNQQQSHRHHQPNDHRETLDRQRPGNPQEHRREFLWRERVKLEMQVQARLSLLQCLEQEWCALQHRKASVEQEKPELGLFQLSDCTSIGASVSCKKRSDLGWR